MEFGKTISFSSSVAVSMAKCSENSLAPNAHPARGVRVTGSDHVSVAPSCSLARSAFKTLCINRYGQLIHYLIPLLLILASDSCIASLRMRTYAIWSRCRVFPTCCGPCCVAFLVRCSSAALYNCLSSSIVRNLVSAGVLCAGHTKITLGAQHSACFMDLVTAWTIWMLLLLSGRGVVVGTTRKNVGTCCGGSTAAIGFVALPPLPAPDACRVFESIMRPVSWHVSVASSLMR